MRIAMRQAVIEAQLKCAIAGSAAINTVIGLEVGRGVFRLVKSAGEDMPSLVLVFGMLGLSALSAVWMLWAAYVKTAHCDHPPVGSIEECDCRQLTRLLGRVGIKCEVGREEIGEGGDE